MSNTKKLLSLTIASSILSFGFLGFFGVASAASPTALTICVKETSGGGNWTLTAHAVCVSAL